MSKILNKNLNKKYWILCNFFVCFLMFFQYDFLCTDCTYVLNQFYSISYNIFDSRTS